MTTDELGYEILTNGNKAIVNIYGLGKKLDIKFEDQITQVELKGDLPQIREIDFSENNIETIKGLSQVYGLENLILDDNQLTEIPTGLNKLRKLKKISIQDNYIEESYNNYKEQKKIQSKNPQCQLTY